MDDIIGELQKFLSTDEGRKTAEELSEMLNGGSAPEEKSESPDLSGLLGLLGSTPRKSESSALISALIPFLSDRRREKAKKAMKILGVISLLPTLQESGILSSLF